MSTLFLGEVLKFYADKFCYNEVEMEFDCSEKLWKFWHRVKFPL